MEGVPEDVLAWMFGFLSIEDMSSAMRCNKRFFSALKKMQHIWKQKCLQFWQQRNFSRLISLELVFEFGNREDWSWYGM